MYLWLKALHIIAVIAWMAGMLYLPRLFVYHCGDNARLDQSETFKMMERRLLKRHHDAGDDRDLDRSALFWLLQGQWLAARLVSGQVCRWCSCCPSCTGYLRIG